MKTIQAFTRVTRGARLAACSVVAIGVALPSLALAQANEPQPRPEKRERSRPQPPQSRPAPPKEEVTPKGDATPDASASASPAKPTFKPPQTAAEKAKVLSDLYAQLATAEDEETAKKLAGSIERLWAFSGSDTTNLLLERATAAIRTKRTELAEKLLDAAVALAPDYPEAFSQRAYFHFNQNNYDGAVGDLRRVLALDPNHFKALEGLAQIFREAGNKKAAFGVLKQLIEVHPFAAGAKAAYEELKREVEGQGI